MSEQEIVRAIVVRPIWHRHPSRPEDRRRQYLPGSADNPTIVEVEADDFRFSTTSESGEPDPFIVPADGSPAPAAAGKAKRKAKRKASGEGGEGDEAGEG